MGLITGAIVLIAIGSGCGTRHLGPHGIQPHGRVFLFRGLLDVPSLGLDSLADKVADEGFDVQVMQGRKWRYVARRETKRYAKEGPDGPLILLGHSYGADNAIRLSRSLDSDGIGIDLLILLDATGPPPIPANVKRCIHYYVPSALGAALPALFAGDPVVAAEGNDRTQIVNATVGDLPISDSAKPGHFTIDASPAIHELCLQEMNQVYLNHRVRRRASSRDGPKGDRG